MNLSAAILEKRQHLAKLRTDRVIRKAMDFSRLEFWPLAKETHVVEISTDRTITNKGVLWLPLSPKE